MRTRRRQPSLKAFHPLSRHGRGGRARSASRVRAFACTHPYPDPLPQAGPLQNLLSFEARLSPRSSGRGGFGRPHPECEGVLRLPACSCLRCEGEARASPRPHPEVRGRSPSLEGEDAYYAMIPRAGEGEGFPASETKERTLVAQDESRASKERTRRKALARDHISVTIRKGLSRSRLAALYAPPPLSPRMV
jgi:hypothetical protein